MERLSGVNLTSIDNDRGTVAKHDWAGQGRCSDGSGSLSFLFFSDEAHEIERARTICRTCPLRVDCFQLALERKEYYGVWGGELFMDGVPMAVRPTRGRPPRTPRQPVPIAEVPVPPYLLDDQVA